MNWKSTNGENGQGNEILTYTANDRPKVGPINFLYKKEFQHFSTFPFYWLQPLKHH